VDEIIERDLPFLSSVVFFDTKREEGTLEPLLQRLRGGLWWWW